MNTSYFIYALEIEKTGSITQAASNLFMSQPTLSKAVIEMEATLGFSVFRRTSKGVIPTERGKEFLLHARKIAAQIQRMEHALRLDAASNQLFSIAFARVEYMAQAVSDFIAGFDNMQEMEIDTLEASSMEVIHAVADRHYVLGLLRYHAVDEAYFHRCLMENALQSQIIGEGKLQVVLNSAHPLAEQELIHREALHDYIEIRYADAEVPYIRRPSFGQDLGKRQVLVNSRSMKYMLLRSNPLTYSFDSVSGSKTLQAMGLVQKPCPETGIFRDVIITHKGYSMSALDRSFLDHLYLRKNNSLYDIRK